MKSIDCKFTLALRLAAATSCAIAAFAGCTPAQVTLTTSPTSSGSGGGSFHLTSIQATLPAAFIVNSSAVAFFGSASLPIIGTCDRGVSGVQITVNSVVQTTTYPCPNLGNVTFTLTFPGDGLYTVLFTPLGADGSAITANALTQGIYVKTSSPPAPTVNNQSSDVPVGVPASGSPSSPFTVSVGPGSGNVVGTIVVNGKTSTVASDFVASISETTFGAGTMVSSASAGTWNYTFTINLGQSIHLSFRDADVVGNLSSVTNILVVTANVMGIQAFTSAALTTPSISGSHKMTAITGAPALGTVASGGHNLFLGVPLDDEQGP